MIQEVTAAQNFNKFLDNIEDETPTSGFLQLINGYGINNLYGNGREDDILDPDLDDYGQSYPSGNNDTNSQNQKNRNNNDKYTYNNNVEQYGDLVSSHVKYLNNLREEIASRTKELETLKNMRSVYTIKGSGESSDYDELSGDGKKKKKKSSKSIPFEHNREKKKFRGNIRERLEQILSKKKLKDEYDLDQLELYFNHKLLDEDFSDENDFGKYAEKIMDGNLFKYDYKSYMMELKNKLKNLKTNSETYGGARYDNDDKNDDDDDEYDEDNEYD